MSDAKYTEEQIDTFDYAQYQWAILDKFGQLGNSVVGEIKKDKQSLILSIKKSGKLTPKN